MAVKLNQPIEEVKRVTDVQITGFEMDYEQGTMTSKYMTLLEDGTPYQRGQIDISDEAEMAELFTKVQERLVGGEDLVTASGAVAYEFVVEKLNG